MRYFFSTGEASGELSATLLAKAIARLDPGAVFEGTGARRMREAGFLVRTDTSGWGSMGPLEAIARIPKLWISMWGTALYLARGGFDLIVLVDFGAVHLRLAKSLRLIGYKGRILYFFPPGAWLDKPKQARAVAALSTPLAAFEHQRDFYRALDLPVRYFGHPLTSAYAMRPARSAPDPLGGTLALLPGSREAELRYHLPVLLDTFERLRAQRPQLRACIGAADDDAERRITAALSARGLSGITVVHSARAALEDADAACIASGTAVLEAALTGVPCVALYILSDAQARIARRVYSGPFVTIPNLVLKKAVIPEFLQSAATPGQLAPALEELLRDPQRQVHEFGALRTMLGGDSALDDCARFAVELARAP